MAVSVSRLQPVKTIAKDVIKTISKADSAPVKIIKTLSRDTLYKTKPDNIRFQATGSGADSTMYVINGVKASKEQFAKAAANFDSEIFLTGTDAKKVFDQADGRHQVLFVTTKDSETGKKFSEKMYKTLGITLGPGKPGTGISITKYRVRSHVSFHSADTASQAIILAPPPVDDKWVIVGPTTTTLTKSNNVVVTVKSSKGTPDVVKEMPSFSIDANPQLTYLSNTFKTDTLYLKNTKGKVYIKKIDYNYDYDNDDDTNNNGISHLSDVMIFIDGKEATQKDIRKLKASDIESLTIKNDAQTKNKYGDKAKKGVLFITTKK